MAPHTGTASINGADIYIEVVGSGPPVVLLHSHLLDSRQWDTQVAALAERYRVIRYDARGFGRSSLPPQPYSHMADLLALLDHLDVPRADLIGCSGGGGICLDAAVNAPERVNSLTLVGAGLTGYQPPLEQIPPEFLKLPEFFQRGDIAGAVEATLHVFTDGARKPEQVDPAVRERTRQLTTELFSRRPVPGAVADVPQPPTYERLRAVKAPTLVLIGSADAPMLHAVATMLVEQIVGAAQLTLHNAGHHPNMEHPAEFNRIVLNYLSRVHATA